MYNITIHKTQHLCRVKNVAKHSVRYKGVLHFDPASLRVGLGSDFWKYGEVMYRTSVLSSFSLSIFFDIQIFMSIAHFSTQAMLS